MREGGKERGKVGAGKLGEASERKGRGKGKRKG